MIHKAIGLFGGTFDPIHYGHLRAALEIYEQLELDEMRLIPCKHPPHRTTPIASADHRLAMVHLATKNTGITIDEREMLREGPSYTVDTLMSFRREFPKASLCMVVGIDAFLGLHTWHQWEKLIQLANIVVLYRTDWVMPETGASRELLLKHALPANEKISHHPAGKIIQCRITRLDISGSTIRSLIQHNHSPCFLLPETVYAYIEQHALYGYKKTEVPLI